MNILIGQFLLGFKIQYLKNVDSGFIGILPLGFFERKINLIPKSRLVEMTYFRIPNLFTKIRFISLNGKFGISNLSKE